MTTKSPWDDDVSVFTRYPGLEPNILQQTMRNQYVKTEGERKEWFKMLPNGSERALLQSSPDNRMLIRENVSTIRATMRERGMVSGGRSEIIVMASVNPDKPSGDQDADADVDYVLAGQHAVIAFYEEMATPEGKANPNMLATLAEGLKVTRISAATPRFARIVFRGEKNILNQVRAQAKSFVETYSEADDINTAWRHELKAKHGCADDENADTTPDKCKLVGKDYDDTMWVFVNANWPGLLPNVAAWKDVRKFKTKSVAKEVHTYAGGIVPKISTVFNRYLTDIAANGRLSDPKFLESSAKYIFYGNLAIFNILDSSRLAHVSPLVMLFCVPNERVPWLIKNRKDVTTKMKALMTPLVETEKNKLSPVTSIKYLTGPGDSRKHVESLNVVSDGINCLEYTLEKVNAEEVDLDRVQSVYDKIVEFGLMGEVEVSDFKNAKDDASWVHPDSMPTNTFSNYWPFKRHARKLLGHYHRHVKGFRFTERCTKGEDEPEDPVDDPEAVAADGPDPKPTVDSVSFIADKDGSWDASAVAGLKFAFDNFQWDEAVVQEFLDKSEAPFDDPESVKRYALLAAGNINRIKRGSQRLDGFCRQIVDKMMGTRLQEFSEQESMGGFLAELVRVVGGVLNGLGEHDVWPIALAAAQCINKKLKPAAKLTSLHPNLEKFEAIGPQKLLMLCEARCFDCLVLLTEALTVIFEEIEGIEAAMPDLKKMKHTVLPTLCKMWQGNLRNIEVAVGTRSPEQWEWLWVNILVNASDKCDKFVSEKNDQELKKMAFTVQTRVNQMPIKDLKESLGIPASSSGTKEELTKKMYDKEYAKAEAADKAKLLNWHTVFASWQQELIAESTKKFDDGLSAEQLAAVDAALADGGQAAKFIRLASTFGSSSSASTSLHIAAFAQEVVLKHCGHDKGTFYAKASAKMSSSTVKVFVDTSDDAKEPYELHFPSRVVAAGGSDAAIGIVKNAGRKGYLFGEVASNRGGICHNTTLVGVPLPSMLQLGDSRVLAWHVPLAKTGEPAVCKTKWVNVTIENDKNCINSVVSVPLLEIDMAALKAAQATEPAGAEAPNTFVELTREPFDIAIDMTRALESAKNSRDALKRLSSPSACSASAKKKRRLQREASASLAADSGACAD